MRKRFKCDVYPEDELIVYIDEIDWDNVKGKFIAIDLEHVEDNCVLLSKEKAEKLVEHINKLISKL
jgi:hypothetical protein